MYVVRPAELADLPKLEVLARRENRRVHTLPKQRDALARQIERSVASFAGAAAMPAGESYTFVLEASDGRLAGTASLVAQAGAEASFLSFRQDMMHQLSPVPHVCNDVETLMLCADLSGYSQLAGYHAPARGLDPAYKALLGRARVMYAALAPQRFAPKFFASLPGPLDKRSGSPFWDAIGRHFFQMDFMQVEGVLEGARNRSLIVGLMPHYPVYMALLPDAARRVVGAVDPCARTAFGILRGEGFESNDYVDICDGGPVLQASLHALKSSAASLRRRVAPRVRGGGSGAQRYLVSNAREYGFRAIAVSCDAVEQQDAITLAPGQCRLLDVGAGDEVVCVPL